MNEGDEALAAYHYSLDHVCSICGAAFVTRKRYDDHRKTHKELMKPNTCPSCKKLFNKLALYVKHLPAHGNRYRCRLCKRRYGTVTLFEEHMRLQHLAEYRALAERSDVVQFIEHYVRVPGEDKLQSREPSPEDESESSRSPVMMPEISLEMDADKEEPRDLSVTERVITNSEGKLVHEMVENGKVINSFVIGDALSQDVSRADSEAGLEESDCEQEGEEELDCEQADTEDPDIVASSNMEETAEEFSNKEGADPMATKSRSESPLEPGEVKYGRIGAVESSQLSPTGPFIPRNLPVENGLSSPGLVPLANLPGFAVSGNVLVPMLGSGPFSMYSSPGALSSNLLPPGLLTPGCNAFGNSGIESPPVLDLSMKNHNDTSNDISTSSRLSSPSCSKSISTPSPAPSPSSAKDSEKCDSPRNDTVYMYHCKVCGSSFLFYQDISRHLLVHTKGRPFKCAICKKGFNTDRGLDEHLRQHKLGPGPYHCPMCNYTSGRHYNLKRHLNTHNPEHTCSVCGLVVGDYSRLRGHMNEHMEKLEVNVASTQLDQETLDRMLAEYKRITALGKTKDYSNKPDKTPSKRRVSSSGSSLKVDNEPPHKKGISDAIRSKLLEKQQSLTSLDLSNADMINLMNQYEGSTPKTSGVQSCHEIEEDILAVSPKREANMQGQIDALTTALTDIQAMQALYGSFAMDKADDDDDTTEPLAKDKNSKNSSLLSETKVKESMSSEPHNKINKPCLSDSDELSLNVCHSTDISSSSNNNNIDKPNETKCLGTKQVGDDLLTNEEPECDKEGEPSVASTSMDVKDSPSKQVTIMVPTPEGLYSYVADRSETGERSDPTTTDANKKTPNGDIQPSLSQNNTVPVPSTPIQSVPLTVPVVSTAGEVLGSPGVLLPGVNGAGLMSSPLVTPPAVLGPMMSPPLHGSPGILAPASLLSSPIIGPSGVVGPGSLLPVFSALDKAPLPVVGTPDGLVPASIQPVMSVATTSTPVVISQPGSILPASPAVCDQLPPGFTGLPPSNMFRQVLVPLSSGAQLMSVSPGGVMQPMSLPLAGTLPSNSITGPLNTVSVTTNPSVDVTMSSVSPSLGSPTQAVWPEMVAIPTVATKKAISAPIIHRCKKCSKEFTEYYQLGAHMAEHVRKVSLLSCPECRLQFRKPKHLEEHVAKAHTGSDSNFKNSKLLNCDQCTYSTSRNYNLQRHMKIHRGEVENV